MTSPEVFREARVRDNRNYISLLRGVMDYVNCGGINVILTPGRYNAAYFEHSYFAEKTGAALVQNTDLFVKDNVLHLKDYQSGKTRVGAVYRKISDEYLDPLTFLPESLIGIPHIMDAYRLFQLERYTERVFITLNSFFRYSDKIIESWDEFPTWLFRGE